MANGGFNTYINKWYLLADTDNALYSNKSMYYRYVKMVFWGPGNAFVDSVNSTTLSRALTQATAIGIGHIDTSYFNLLLNTGASEKDRLLTGTSDGKLYVHEYDPGAGQVKMVYNFYGGAAGDRFSLGTNIWDIVEVKNSGTLPTWFGINDPINESINFTTNPYFTGSFYSETYAHLNALELISPNLARPNNDLIVTNNVGKVFLYFAGGAVAAPANTNEFFSQVNNYYGPLGRPISLAFGDTNGDNYSDLMVAASWDQVVVDPLSNNPTTHASIRLWHSTSVGAAFSGNLDITTLETTGSLATALKYTQAKVGVTLVDLDGDGDLDIIFTTGQTYVLWNIANYLVWRFDSSYLANINANMASRLYEAPNALDVDLDGDMDLIFSYAQSGPKPRNGAVYYRNDGFTNGQPVYVLQKGLFVNNNNATNLDLNNYTSFSFSLDWKTGKILNMTSYNPKLNALVGFKADYTTHNNYIVATDPMLYRVEINLRNSPMYKNYGYRIAQTWSTEPEFTHWTQSIQTSDLNGDGRNEIVVGDFDNNMYIFDYLTSGFNGSVTTYKIAYKSPNLVQHQTLNQSPYASDQLAGLKGNFTRTIWRNAKFVMAGVDLNNNGRQEVVVTAGLAFYVFELDPAGNDLYDLIYTQDLSNSIFQPLIGKYSEFTALGGGVDTDYNGRGEIMLALGPSLFIFEYAGLGAFEEVYAGYPAIGGRYFSVGNPIFANFFNDYVYKNLIITSIAVGDVNNNQYQDIVVGGYYQEPYGRLDGSVTILENRLGTIVPVFEFTPRDLQEAPVNDIKIADQDYDRNLEILLATDKGVDVWEYQPNPTNDFQFKLTGMITSSMNHPIPSLSYLAPAYSTPDKTIYGTSQDLVVLRSGIQLPVTGVQLKPGDQIEIASVAGRLVMAYSQNDGKTWKLIANGATYFVTGTSMYGTNINFVEYDPSIIQLPDGTLGIAYMENLAYLGITQTSIKTFQLSATTLSSLGTPTAFTTPFPINSTLTGNLGSPSIFVDPTNGAYNDYEYSIAYLDTAAHRVFIYNGYYYNTVQVPIKFFGRNILSENATYLADRIDVAYYPLTNQYVMAFSGRIYNETKYDADIFTSVSNNNSLIPFYTARVSFDDTQDRYPSISVLEDNHSYGLVIVYEEIGIDPGHRIMASHSNDIAKTWNIPEPMNRAPDYLINVCFTQLALGCFMFLVSDPSIANQPNPALHPTSDTLIYDALQSYQNQQDYKNQTFFNNSGLLFFWVTSMVTQRPAIAGRSTGGFAYSFSTTLYIGNIITLFQRIAAALALLNQKSNNRMSVETVAAVANNDLVRNSIVVGKIATIAIGVNPNSEFIKFNVGKALQIDIGDTDGDGRKEIVIGSDRGVFLSELSHTTALSQIYDPIWQKTDYTFGIHDVALGDTNGDGFDDILVAGEKGNVFAYEMKNTNSPITHFDFTTQIYSTSSGFTNEPAPTTPVQDLIQTVNINGDNVLDMVYPSMHNDGTKVQVIYAIDGQTGASLWNYSLSAVGDQVTSLQKFDYNSDGNLDIIVGTQLGYLYVINSQNGQELLKVQCASSIQKVIAGLFYSGGTISFAILNNDKLILYDPVAGSLTIHDYSGDSVYPGKFADLVAVKVKNTNLVQILTVTSHGIARVFDASIPTTPVYTLNGVPFGNVGNGTLIDYSTSVAKYNIDADNLDEMFVAINSTVYAFDDTGVPLWNNTNLKMSQNLDKLTVVHSNALNKNILTVISYPELITFDEYSGQYYPNLAGNYSYLGVNFGAGRNFAWSMFNMTWLAQYYQSLTGTDVSIWTTYPHSGVMVAYGSGQENEYIEFNTSQQYVSFFLSSWFDDQIRVIGLDETNQTVYMSDFLHQGANQQVVIALDNPLVKRIIFEGNTTNSIFFIDDLKFGGSNIFGFDANTGEQLWRNEYVPTESISFNPNVDSNGNLLDTTVPVAYFIDQTFTPNIDFEQGFLGLNVENGKANFMNSDLSLQTISGVSLGQGLYSFMAFDPFASNAKHYILHTLRLISSTYSTNLPYAVQNVADKQVNTNKIFKAFVTGNLDTDPYQEMVLYNNRLIVAMDNNGQFIWKFVTTTNISQVLLADLDNSGIDEVVVMLSDNSILTLDPKFGIQLSYQNLPFFLPVKILATDVSGDGIPDIIVAEKNLGNTGGGLIALSYHPTTNNFTIAAYSGFYTGVFVDVMLADFDGDSKNNDFLLYFDSQIVLLKQNLGIKNYLKDSIKAVTVADYNQDGVTDFAYINGGNYLIVKDLGNNTLSQRKVFTGWLLVSGMNALYSLHLTGDTKPEIVQYQFGVGYALYDPLNGSHLYAYWQERSFIAGFMTSMDLDSDGHNELVLRNERLIYAIKLNSTTNQLYTFWSSPLSLWPLLQASPINLNGSTAQMVFLNIFGQIFVVRGIVNPETTVQYDLRFTYQSMKLSVKGIDSFTWSINNWPDDLVNPTIPTIPAIPFTNIPNLDNGRLQTQQNHDALLTLEINPLIVFGITFSFGFVAMVVLRRKIVMKRSKTTMNTAEESFTATGVDEV